METDYRRAIHLARGEKRLWAAGLIAALTLSEAWWVIFGWGPECLGERWRRAVGESMGEAGALLSFVLAALVAFAILKALGYLGEMVLVRQVAEAAGERVPRFRHALPPSWGRYARFAATLLPLDALRIALVYLPTLIIAFWNRWDPRFNHFGLYILAILCWVFLLFSVYILAGIIAALSARLSLLERAGLPEAWLDAWSLLRAVPQRLTLVWLQAMAADVIFVALAWPLSALVPWAVGLAADAVNFFFLRWLIYLAAYAVFAAALVAGQMVVQCYKSSLWTLTYLQIRRGEAGEEAGATASGRITEPPAEFMPHS